MMTETNKAVPIGEAALKDPAVQQLVEKIERGEVHLSTPVARYQPTEDDLRRLDMVLDRIFGINPEDKG
jgi:exonuclease VII small subunit